MNHFQQYLSILKTKSQVESITSTSNDVARAISDKFCAQKQLTGLLLGNVQSGKTAQMLGVISNLADKGYNFFLLLTTDNVDLQRQTYNRVKDSLLSFYVLSEMDTSLFNPNNMMKPYVIVLKKNSSVLKKWGNILATARIGLGQCLCIFDDEADAASLNTLVNRSRVSTINAYLQKIKDTAAITLYIEVTATPQAVLLQTSFSGWKPSFVKYIKPGDDYLGGNFFYSSPKSYCIRYTADTELDDIKEDGDLVCPEGLRKSIMSFLVICAYKKMNRKSNCNFMIHPSTRIADHQKFTDYVQEYLNLLQQSTTDEGFDLQLKEAWEDLQQTKPDLPHYEEIREEVVNILDNTLVCTIPLNSKSTINRDPNDPDSLRLDRGFNIVIGGNTLGRGITFPKLQTVYYCRSSKVPQADTFWQHSRIFGYDREKELVRIFIPKCLHSLFVSLNESNEMLTKQIENGVDKIQVIYPNNIKPTRKNVLDNKYLNMIVGGVNMFSTNPIPFNTIKINELVEKYSTEESVEVSTEELLEVLNYIGDIDNAVFDSSKFRSCIEAMKEKRPSIKCRMIVRTNRNIARGTGTMLSPTDRKLGDAFNKQIVLTLYRINGSVDKGWSGYPLWIPNIKFPSDTCFYDVKE